MVLHSDDPAAGGLGGVDDGLCVQGLDGEGVDDTDVDAGILQLGVGAQSLSHGDGSRNHCHYITVTLVDNLHTKTRGRASIIMAVTMIIIIIIMMRIITKIMMRRVIIIIIITMITITIIMMIRVIIIITLIMMMTQGLTLNFQARGPKRSFEKNKWSKTGFLVIIHTIFGPLA